MFFQFSTQQKVAFGAFGRRFCGLSALAPAGNIPSTSYTLSINSNCLQHFELAVDTQNGIFCGCPYPWKLFLQLSQLNVPFGVSSLDFYFPFGFVQLELSPAKFPFGSFPFAVSLYQFPLESFPLEASRRMFPSRSSYQKFPLSKVPFGSCSSEFTLHHAPQRFCCKKSFVRGGGLRPGGHELDESLRRQPGAGGQAQRGAVRGVAPRTTRLEFVDGSCLAAEACGRAQRKDGERKD